MSRLYQPPATARMYMSDDIANRPMLRNNGMIAEARLDDMAERIVAAWYFLSQGNNYPAVSFNQASPHDLDTNQHVDMQDDHFKIVREISVTSVILLKNITSNDSGPSLRGPNGYPGNAGDDGTLAIGWGSGSGSFPYLITPLEAIQARAREDCSSVLWFLSNWDLAGAANTALDQDVVLVFVNTDSGEGAIIVGDYSPESQGMILVDGMAGDRSNLMLWGNVDALVNAVAAVNPNTIVDVHSVGPAIVESSMENPHVTAVLWAGLQPRQESGNSLVDVLYGAVKPSGRLPYTITKDPADYTAQLG
ncbi:hypothetical protein V8D89_007179 [Ganoderma adspersum]